MRKDTEEPEQQRELNLNSSSLSYKCIYKRSLHKLSWALFRQRAESPPKESPLQDSMVTVLQNMMGQARGQVLSKTPEGRMKEEHRD